MKEEIQKKDQNSIPEDLKELIIARIDVSFPSDKKISIGSIGEEFTKSDLIKHVEKGDDVGKKVVDLELAFLKALKEGELLSGVLAGD